MFNKGDKVVCISDEWIKLKFGHIYNIKKIMKYKDSGFWITPVDIINFNVKYAQYPIDSFISLIEYRRNKIINIKNKIKNPD